jgi:ABC-type Co2+ transport system permease subunit
MVGLVTPWVALLTGIMKLVPAVPVIMVGNAVLCLIAGYLDRFNRYLAMGLAAACKFLAMTAGVKILIGRGTNIPAPVYSMLTVNQLVTALLGGVLASIVLIALEKFDKR